MRGGEGGGGEGGGIGYDHLTLTIPKPCYLRRFCLFVQHVAGGCLMFSKTGAVTRVHAVLRTCPKPCYLRRFCLFVQHVAGGCLMFSHTRHCHKRSCHFANMTKTLLFAAVLLLLYNVRLIEHNYSWVWRWQLVPKRTSWIAWGRCAKMSALSLSSWIS